MNADEIVKALRCYASDCGDDEACGQCTFAWMCEEMDGNAPKIIADLIESLTAQLAASQRREKAAVEDIYLLESCDVCTHYDSQNNVCTRPLEPSGTCFEWRGQEAGKGDAE